MKQLHIIPIIFIAIVLIACNRDDTDFTYSPTEPKAGDTIAFTPYGSSAEEWEWDFGDGTSANIANYKKIYKIKVQKTKLWKDTSYAKSMIN